MVQREDVKLKKKVKILNSFTLKVLQVFSSHRLWGEV